MKPLKVTGRACSSCPYLRSHPSGVWSRDEYEKLRLYDTGHEVPCPNADGTPATVRVPELATFWCHQTNRTGQPTACRGWLSAHRSHAAVNLAMAFGAIRPEDIPTEDESDIYFQTGTEAAENGLRDIDAPDTEACEMAERLVKKRAGAWEEPRQVPGKVRIVPAPPGEDPNICSRGCGRKGVFYAPIFGEPGGPGCGGLFCAPCVSEERKPTWCDPDAKLDDLGIKGHAGSVVRKLQSAHGVTTLRDLAKLGRDMVRIQRGAGPGAMGQFERLLALAELTWA
jgi:hypothetical protein